MSDIFISYKREDQLHARQLADALERQGWSVWWDPKLHAGERFDDVIENALLAARCVVVVWSQRSIDSAYVRDEATYALNRNKLVPLKIEEVELPFRFEGIHTPQLVDWDGTEMAPAFQSILRDIIVILGPSPRMEEQRKAEEEAERLVVGEEKQKQAERERQKELTLEIERKATEEQRRKAEKVRIASDAAKHSEQNAPATSKAIEPTVPTTVFSSQEKWLAIIILVFGVIFALRYYWLSSAEERHEVNTASSNPSSSRSAQSEKQPIHLPRAQHLALSQTQWKNVQRSLNDIGFDAGPTDGVPGSKTQQAISLFQISRGFPATGMFTETQLARLFSDARSAAHGQLGADKQPTTQSPPFDPEEEKTAYQRAFEMLNSRDYPGAIQGFRRYLSDFPNGNYVANAKYWIGEANYVLSNFHVAIGDFTEVLEQYPSSSKASGALLKIGLIHYALGEWFKAKEILRRVIREYPGSAAARVAQQHLEKMQREGR